MSVTDVLGTSTDTLQFWLVAFLLVFTLAGLIFNLLSPEKLFIFVATVLLLSGTLTPAETLAGFANTGIFTIAALYVVVAGLKEAGATQLIRRYLVGTPSIASGLWTTTDSPLGALIAIYVTTIVLTELMTHNAAAIVMLPIGMSTIEKSDALECSNNSGTTVCVI